jgi:hypothetical protein
MPTVPSSSGKGGDETRRNIAAALGVGLMVGAIGACVGLLSTAHSWVLRLTPPVVMLVAGAFIVAWAWRRRPAAHQPPGGGQPLRPPLDYQVNALRQVIVRLGVTTDRFGLNGVYNVLQKLQRHGTDPLYEPLSPSVCREGLARLVELGELEVIGKTEVGPHSWRIVKP